MEENHYWQDVVAVTVQSDLSANPDSTIHNKAYVCLAGDSNDDGKFAIADVIKLQKCLLTADTMYEREAIAFGRSLLVRFGGLSGASTGRCG